MKPRQHVNWIATPQLPYSLNLSPGFNPVALKSIPLKFKTFNFLGGEPHFQILSEDLYESPVIITQRYNKIGDLFDIILANDALRRMGVKNVELVLPYFPAARQDRVCNEGEPLTIKVFTDLINGCNFDKVTILCPHSEVTPALINNVHVLDELKYVEEIVKNNLDGHFFNVVCPDAGAGKRVGKVVKHLSNTFGYVQFNLIRCEKERDVKDGKLKGFYIQAEDLGVHPTLIVDDIVAMGGTFMGLGDKLKEKNCGKLMLFTAHADCGEGLDKMMEYFDHVYTTNSKENWEDLCEKPGIQNITSFPIIL